MRLAVRTPFAGRALLAFLAYHLVPGVEVAGDAGPAPAPRFSRTPAPAVPAAPPTEATAIDQVWA